MGGGGGCHPPAPSLCLILEPRRLIRFEKFFMGRCAKDEPTGKNLVCKKALPISEKNRKNLLGGGDPPLAIGGLNISERLFYTFQFKLGGSSAKNLEPML